MIAPDLITSIVSLRRRERYSCKTKPRPPTERVLIDEENSGWVVVLGYQVMESRQPADLHFVMKKIAFGVRVDVDAFANRLFPNSEIGSKRFIE